MLRGLLPSVFALAEPAYWKWRVPISRSAVWFLSMEDYQKTPAGPQEKYNRKCWFATVQNDPYEPQAEVLAFQQEMRDSKADWQMIFYANAVHSFTDPNAGNNNSKGAAYNELAAKRSWQHMRLFLDEVFAK